jgi:high-affinity Fe2+/Pb2+ permease
MKSTLPILTAIFGAVIYHISSKSFPKSLHPLIGIIFAYVAAIIVCLGLLLFREEVSWTNSLKEINLAVVGVGIGAVIVEVGFLLAYRAGW